jgi:hypothetical protein
MYPNLRCLAAALAGAISTVLLKFAVASTAASNPTNLVPERAAGRGVPILLYHRFGPVVADSMIIRTSVFQSHLRFLREHGYTVVPLRAVVDWVRGKGPPPPPRSVVICIRQGISSGFPDTATRSRILMRSSIYRSSGRVSAPGWLR